MPKFAEMLDRKAEDIQRPPNIPAGYYVAQISRAPETGELKQGEYEYLDFPVTLMEPYEDTVDEDELKAFGSISGQRMSKRFIFPTADDQSASFERTMFNIRRLLEGLDIGFSEDGDMSLKQALSECVGSRVLVEVTHRENPNEQGVFFDEVGRMAPES